MTLYETMFTRRQVRKYHASSLDTQVLDNIFSFVSEIDQIDGKRAAIQLASANEINGGSAPHYLIGSCDEESLAHANVGYVLQKADLYIQSLGLGSGWFMGAQPKDQQKNHCITLAFGRTDAPARKSADEFKRLSIEKISTVDNAIARAVQVAPSSMNSQPWQLVFSNGKVIIREQGRGLMRVMLRNKLNKIDLGIAARHAVLALEQEGKTVSGLVPKSTGKDLEIEITYA